MQHWGCGPFQVCTYDDLGLTLTFFTTRSILIPNAFIWGKSVKVYFSVTVKAKTVILTRNI